MAATTDVEIIDLYRAGNVEQAFSLLVSSHGDAIYNLALFTLNDEVLAQDASQEVFIKIYRNLEKFKGDAKLSTWLFRIAKNVCYDFLKKRKTDRFEDGQEGQLVSENIGPETDTMLNWDHQQLRGAVAGLPDFQRMAVNLYYFQERTYEEVAEIMEQPMGTIKSHLYRGKAALAEALGENENES